MPALLRLLSAVLLAVAFCLSGASAHAPAPFPKKDRPTGMPVGRWTVTFENGVPVRK